MNQSFSTENFVKIFYDENRKGNYIEGEFSIFQPLQKISKSIKKINQNFKSKFYTTHDKIQQANKSKDLLREKKFIKLGSILEEVELKICKKDYSIDLTTSTVRNKTVYSISRTNPEVFFLLKQVQKNIQHSFKVKQSDRYEVVSQVINLLDNNFPKYIIRTDIKSFFESIPHEKLKEKIQKNYILSSESKKIIYSILREYKSITEDNKGIPRGIGISAYLSELYMRDIDNKIKEMPNLTYYARYVDDMILIFTPCSQYDNKRYFDAIKEFVENEGLILNLEKTKELNLFTTQNFSLDFLGYKIDKNSTPIRINITKEKEKKYKKKILLAIEDYNSNSKYNEKNARRLLCNRLKYLTGNIRLLNAKKNILVGVYFSNILLNQLMSLSSLDSFFQALIDTKLAPYSELSHVQAKIEDLKTKLKKFSFKNGYENKKFYKFKKDELEEILKIWKAL